MYQWQILSVSNEWIDLPFYGSYVPVESSGSDMYRCKVTNKVTGEESFSKSACMKQDIVLISAEQVDSSSTIRFTFAGGALVYTAGEGEAAVKVTLQLQEDYLLRVTLNAGETETVLLLTSTPLPGTE